MCAFDAWVKSRCRAVVHSVVVPLADAIVFESNPNRWAFIFPHVNGTGIARWMPDEIQVNSSYFIFSSSQFQGNRTYWDYMTIGPLIEHRWFAGTAGGPITMNVVELVVDQDVKRMIERMQPPEWKIDESFPRPGV